MKIASNLWFNIIIQNHNIDYNVFIPVMQDIINKGMANIQFPDVSFFNRIFYHSVICIKNFNNQ